MSVRKAVIPAAGLGTRLYPATKSQPKEMLPLGTKPTIQLVAEELVETGLRDILIVIGKQKNAIADHLDPADGLPPGTNCDTCAELFDESLVRFFYTRQSVPRGLGDAVAHARRFVAEEHFAVALGDCVIVGGSGQTLLQRLVEAHTRLKSVATIAVQRVPLAATSRYGIIAPRRQDDAGALELAGIVEKPGPENAPSDLAVCARYVFSPVIFDHLDRTRPGRGGEVQLTDAIQSLIAEGLPVYAVPLDEGEERLDVGNFESYTKAFIRLMSSHPEHGAAVRSYMRQVLARCPEDS